MRKSPCATPHSDDIAARCRQKYGRIYRIRCGDCSWVRGPATSRRDSGAVAPPLWAAQSLWENGWFRLSWCSSFLQILSRPLFCLSNPQGLSWLKRRSEELDEEKPSVNATLQTGCNTYGTNCHDIPGDARREEPFHHFQPHSAAELPRWCNLSAAKSEPKSSSTLTACGAKLPNLSFSAKSPMWYFFL